MAYTHGILDINRVPHSNIVCGMDRWKCARDLCEIHIFNKSLVIYNPSCLVHFASNTCRLNCSPIFRTARLDDMIDTIVTGLFSITRRRRSAITGLNEYIRVLESSFPSLQFTICWISRGLGKLPDLQKNISQTFYCFRVVIWTIHGGQALILIY